MDFVKCFKEVKNRKPASPLKWAISQRRACLGQLLVELGHHLSSFPWADICHKLLWGVDLCSCPMMKTEVSSTSLHHSAMALELPSTLMNNTLMIYKNYSLINYIVHFEEFELTSCISTPHVASLPSTCLPNCIHTIQLNQSNWP